MGSALRLLQALGDRGFDASAPGIAGEDKEFGAEPFGVLAEVFQFSLALNIPGGACDDICHQKLLLACLFFVKFIIRYVPQEGKGNKLEFSQILQSGYENRTEPELRSKKPLGPDRRGRGKFPPLGTGFAG